VNRTLKTLAAALLGSGALLAANPATSPAQAPAPAPAPAGFPSAPDAALAWNQVLLGLQATPGVQPATVHPTYELAIVQSAIHDAVVSIDGREAPYIAGVRARRTASKEAAADAAAHDTLVALYPAQRATLDADQATAISHLTNDARRSTGLAAGRRVARAVLAARRVDHADATPPAFAPTGFPGDYAFTPPAFGQPVFTHWSHVRPFALARASQFRPGPPPSLTGVHYAAALHEVQVLGDAASTVRTPEQTQIGQFWNAPIWATWNRIADSVATSRNRGLGSDARTLARLDLTLADATIALYDAKYAYHLWRPVTAIRNADVDGNPLTNADKSWSPLSPTAPDPSYPGAHATISAAAAAVLAEAYGNKTSLQVTSPTLPGVTRTFGTFGQAAAEASVSRILNGNHTRIDEAVGEHLGGSVARQVLKHVS
jgi:membrane-associated phospholipid phosphatase